MKEVLLALLSVGDLIPAKYEDLTRSKPIYFYSLMIISLNSDDICVKDELKFYYKIRKSDINVIHGNLLINVEDLTLLDYER